MDRNVVRDGSPQKKDTSAKGRTWLVQIEEFQQSWRLAKSVSQMDDHVEVNAVTPWVAWKHVLSPLWNDSGFGAPTSEVSFSRRRFVNFIITRRQHQHQKLRRHSNFCFTCYQETAEQMLDANPERAEKLKGKVSHPNLHPPN